MASPPKKPRDIKNLKARLGKTITPSQAGLPTPGVPGGTPPVGSIPPGQLGAPTPAPGTVPAPFSSPGGLPAPASAPGGLPNPLGASVPAPAVGPAAQAAAQAAAPARPAAAPSPFGAPAAAPVGAERKVTLVIDDSAVDDAEIGKKNSSKAAVLVGIGTAVGLVIGLSVGSTNATNNLWNMAVADGKDIYTKVNEVSKTMDTAKGLLKKAADASQGGAGKKAHLDYAALEGLVALERPLSANEFHRRRYLAFPVGVVDALFEYYNHINMIWDRIATLGAKTSGKKRRAALDKSAAATDGLLDNQFAMVLSKQGEMFAGGLVYMTIPQAGSAAADAAKDKKKAEEAGAPMVMVASRQGGREVERQLFVGQEDVAEKYGNYAFLVDKGRSMAILGEQAAIFGKVRADLNGLNALMTKAYENQGVLMKELGKVAALPERFAL